MTSAARDARPLRAGAVVLAAGASRRMGSPKALLDLHGVPLLTRIVRTAAGAGAAPIVVAIAPPHGEAVRAALAPVLPVAWAVNPAPERGMLSSVQAALPVLVGLLDPAGAPLDGALIWPVDVPLVAPATAAALLSAAHAAPGRLVVPTHGDRGGHPLWLPQALFAEALALGPDRGLRALRDRHPAIRLPVPDPEILRDLDTPEDLARARG